MIATKANTSGDGVILANQMEKVLQIMVSGTLLPRPTLKPTRMALPVFGSFASIGYCGFNDFPVCTFGQGCNDPSDVGKNNEVICRRQSCNLCGR